MRFKIIAYDPLREITIAELNALAFPGSQLPYSHLEAVISTIADTAFDVLPNAHFLVADEFGDGLRLTARDKRGEFHFVLGRNELAAAGVHDAQRWACDYARDAVVFMAASLDGGHPDPSKVGTA